MNETYYGILMIKNIIDDCIYHFYPQTIIKGTLLEEDIFKDDAGNDYMTVFNGDLVDNDIRDAIGFYISEENLLNKYYDLSIDEAKERYFDEIRSINYFGFYLYSIGKIAIVPLNLQEKLTSFNETVSVNELIQHISIDSINQGESASYENINTEENEDVINIDEEVLNNLLKIDNLEDLKNELKTMKNLVRKPNFKNKKDIYNYLKSGYDDMLKMNDINLLKKTIKEIKEFYIEFLVSLDEYKENNKIKEFKESIYLTVDTYEKLMETNDIKYIKSQITKIKKYNLQRLEELTFETPEKKESNKVIKKEINVKEMKMFLDERIIGLGEAKRKMISIIVENNNNLGRFRKSALFIGSTGSGKTYLAEVVSEYLNIPFEIVDMLQLTVQGYIGRKLEDNLSSLIKKANGDIELAEKGIIFFNEIDKKGSSNNSDVSGRGVLNELLTFFDGTTYKVEYNNKIYNFNTSKLTILAGGSFLDIAKLKGKNSYGFIKESKKEDYESITLEDLNEHGNMPLELLGRFTDIITIPTHTKESLLKILLTPLASPLLMRKDILKKEDIELEFDEEYLQEVVTKALKLKTGARSLNKTIENSLEYARWFTLENPNMYQKIILNKDSVNDNTCALLEDIYGNVCFVSDLINEELKRDLKI